MLVVLALVVALGAAAYADGSCTITVNNAMQGETYTAYKMLDVSVNSDYSSYAYILDTKGQWNDFFTTGAGKDYVDITVIDDVSYVTWKEKADVAAFAKAAETFANGKASTATAVGVASATAPVTVTASFTSLDAGYYLITSSGGTKVIVDTTPANPNPTINDKNEAPTLDKQVQEDSTSNWVDSNTAQIGDTVNFKVTIIVQPGALNYVMHDEMDDGLTFNSNSVAVKNGETALANETYTVSTAGLTDDCTFEIAFNQDYLNSITASTTITVTYSAVLNENAEPDTAEFNKAYLKYGSTDNTDSKTPEKQTETNTYKFSVLKYVGDAEGNEGTIDLTNKSALAGAVFKLQVVNGKVATDIQLVKVNDTTYRIAKAGETGAVDTFTTVANGQISIIGVDLEDKYQLVEVTAPAGYNLLKDPVSVTVNSNNNLVVGVANYAGTELPSTGGTGTTMIYLVGSVLVAAALVLFITKRRIDAGR